MTARLPDPSVGALTDPRQRVADLEQENARRRQDRAEGAARESATSEILRVIVSSPTELQAALDAVAEQAARLCDPHDVVILRVDGDAIRPVAAYGGELRVPPPLDRGAVAGRAILDRETIHIHDMAAEPDDDFPITKAIAKEFGRRIILATPLVREGVGLGAIVVRHVEVRPFTDEQIKLLETFADQAVIAIENARLFDELAELNRTLETRVNEQVEQLERIGRLRRYLSPQLADLIVSSGEESILESHRRLITVVFCDLRGFTAFAETAEPEEVTGVLDEFHAAVGELIREYEGTLDRFAGDGLMVFFNDPLPQPDHTERAVRMACAMRARTADLARGWRRAGYELDFGVGIAVGHATLGRIGFEGRYDYTAIGTVANLAARLCGEAAGGQILIPARLLGMIEALIETEPVGELALKGFHRSVSAFNITGLRDGESTEADGTT